MYPIRRPAIDLVESIAYIIQYIPCK